MTIQLQYYLRLYGMDKTTISNQIQFFVSGNSFKDILDKADRFVADYIQYIRKQQQEKFTKMEYDTSEDLKTEVVFEYNIPNKKNRRLIIMS